MRRAQRRLEKIDAIIDGALEAFLDTGFTATSMDAIVEKTGISKRTIYKYFDGKDMLFEAILERAVGKVVYDFPTSLEKDQSVEEGLRQIANNFVSTVLSPDLLALHRLVVGEVQRFPALGARYYQAGYLKTAHALEIYFAALKASGNFDLPDPTLASHQFWGLVLSYCHTFALFHPEAPLGSAEVEQQVNDGIAAFLKLYAL